MTFVRSTSCRVVDLVMWSYCGKLLYITVIGVVRVIWLMAMAGGCKSTVDSRQEQQEVEGRLERGGRSV